MFSDPQSLTIGGTATPLARVSMGNRTGTFENADNTIALQISHTNGKSERGVVRLDAKKVAPDPVNPAVNRTYKAAVYTVIDKPSNVGYTDAEVSDLAKALMAWLTVPANLTKFLGQES